MATGNSINGLWLYTSAIKIGLIILGAGGYAKQVHWVAQRTEKFSIVGFLDETIESASTLSGLPVYNLIEEFEGLESGEVFLISAVGDISLRRRWYNSFRKNYRFATLIDPSAIIAPDVRIGHDVVLLANVVCSCESSIGNGVHINWGSLVSHGVRVGDLCNIASGVKLTGNSKLGEAVDMGTNSTVLPGVSIGDRVIVGAGAVVTRNITSDCTAVGVPAKIIKSENVIDS